MGWLFPCFHRLNEFLRYGLGQRRNQVSQLGQFFIGIVLGDCSPLT